MKIKTKFDIIKKIRHSKEGISAKDIFIKSIKEIFFMYIANAMYFINGIINKDIPIICLNLTGYVVCYFLCNLGSKITKSKTKADAQIDLQKLVNELSNLEVKTSVELLQEAKINQVNYKIEYTDDSRLPVLKQYKYIDVPLSNGHEETILQEHTYLDKDYDISVNSPVKKMAYKTVKAGI